MQAYIDAKIEDQQFSFSLDRTSGITVVKVPGEATPDYEAIASYICNNYRIRPLKLVLFSKEDGQWQMLLFSEFYNKKYRVYSKEPVSYQDIKHLVSKDPAAMEDKQKDSRIRILKDSPDPNDQTAHLRPVIEFLIEQGNIPHSKHFTFENGGIGTFLFFGPIDPEALKEKFIFPESIQVGIDEYYAGGVIWDQRNALKIHRGI
jgi:hypothetical protein